MRIERKESFLPFSLANLYPLASSLHDERTSSKRRSDSIERKRKRKRREREREIAHAYIYYY